MRQTCRVQPGWYEDPLSRGWLRWWDGQQWTAHQAPAGAAPSNPTYGMWAPTPAGDLSAEDRWLPWLTWAVFASAALFVVAYVVAVPIFGHYVHNVVKSCVDQIDNGATHCVTPHTNGSQQLWGNLVYLPLAADIVMMMWLRKVAEIARRLGIPARRSPGWAFGFFVPVVNLWFPYQVAADTMPPGDARRSTVGWWWAFMLLRGAGLITVFVVALFSERAAIVLGVFGSALPVLAAVLGVRMAKSIHAAHREILGAPAAVMR